MKKEKTAQAYAELFDIPQSHSLTLHQGSTQKRDSTIYETRWMDEHDCNSRLIARFRTWTNRQLKPPYKQQTGWERFSTKGVLLDREVRYFERDNNDYLH